MVRLRQEDVVTISVLKDKGVPQRAIARQLGVTEGAVRWHVRRQAAGATDGRQGKTFKASALSAVIEHWREGQAAGGRPGNLAALFEHLVSEHGYAGSYQSLRRYVRHRFGRPAVRTWRRVETPPGGQSQTDWGHFPDVDLGDGPEPMLAFVMVLSHSRKTAVIWSRHQDQVSWLACHNAAFQRLGGIAATNRIDNVKTAIAIGAGAWGTIHPVYRSYARSVGFHVDACAPRDPQAKGKTEAKVHLSRLLLDPARRRWDGGLAELQADTDARLARWAARTLCPATGLTVAASWEAERPRLRPLPEILPEPFDVSVSRPVRRDCTLAFEGRAYTVPFTYVGRQLQVRGCADSVQIFSPQGALLVSYPRHTAQRVLIDLRCYEGAATADVLPPPPLGRMGRRLTEIWAQPVEQRPLDLYAALAEVAR